MRFEIERTHVWEFDARRPPCEGAEVGVGAEGKKAWFVEIGTLEELLGLAEKLQEELIIGEYEGNWRIEIYDDYRE